MPSFIKHLFPIEISHKDFIDSAEKTVEILEEPLANQCSILNYKMANSIEEKILIKEMEEMKSSQVMIVIEAYILFI